MSSMIQLNPLNITGNATGAGADRHRDIETGGADTTGVLQNIGSLPIMAADIDSGATLHQRLLQHKDVFTLLAVTGNYWPSTNTMQDILHKIYFIIARLAIAVTSAVTLVFAISSIFYSDSIGELVAVTVNITLFCGFVSVAPAQYNNQLRMMRPVHGHDLLGIDECVRVAILFGAVSVLCILVAFVICFFSTVQGWLFLFQVSQFALAAYLAFNLLFLLLDLKASLLLLDQLHLLADNKTLNMDTFNAVRSEIHRRVDNSRWASDLIILPCVLSVICFVVLIADIDKGVSAKFTLTIIALMLSLLKEIFFIGIAFYYVSQVNEKADALTLKLSAQVWYPESEYVHKADMQRVSIHASSVTNPVSFTLVYKRLSWRNVAVSAVGFGITVLVALIRSIVGV